MAKKSADIKFYEAIGRRKSSTALVRLYLSAKEKEITIKDKKIKKGDIIINHKDSKEYFPLETFQKKYQIPLDITNSLDRFAISIKVSGGGMRGQLEAIQHGLSRALEMVDNANRPLLKKQGLLTRDPRVKERRKVGTGGKARHQKQSPKR